MFVIYIIKQCKIKNCGLLNPHDILQMKTQYTRMINIWAGILGRYINEQFKKNKSLVGEGFLQLFKVEVTGDMVLDR